MVRKTACFLFLIMLISPLYAQSFPEPQPNPQDEGSPPAPQPGPEGEASPPAEEFDEGLFFFEELFIFEETFSLDRSPIDEEILPDEEPLLSEETPPGEEPLLSEETSPGEEPPISEETPPSEEPLLSEEIPPSEEPPISEEAPPSEETLLAEDPFIDDDAFFFEAPPLIFEVPEFETRSFNAIFPNISRRQRGAVMSHIGLRNSFVQGESPMLVPNPDLEIDLFGAVMKKKPSHIIEALVVVPYTEKELDLLDIYNALGRIEKIKDYPASMNGNALYIFTESTRIESARTRKAIPDPAPALTLPFSQTMYLRLKEINFGNLFIRGEISISMYGITYSMTNFTDVRYFLVPVMKAERFITIIYLEPVKEGILIYSMSGFYLPGFIADKVNLTPNINRRIQIFTNWITDGLREQNSTTN